MDEDVPQDELLRLASLRYSAKNGDVEASNALKEAIIARKALPLLRECSKELVSCFGRRRIRWDEEGNIGCYRRISCFFCRFHG